MKKKVIWDEPVLTKAPKKGYNSIAEYMAKAQAYQQQQEEAESYMAKAMPAMLKLLEIRLQNQEPLVVMRPLTYQTSDLQKSEDDDGFYFQKNPRVNDKFIDIVKTIHPGTQLVLKSIDPAMQEFIFKSSDGKEHCISFADRNKLLTATNIFETIKMYFENGSLK